MALYVHVIKCSRTSKFVDPTLHITYLSLRNIEKWSHIPCLLLWLWWIYFSPSWVNPSSKQPLEYSTVSILLNPTVKILRWFALIFWNPILFQLFIVQTLSSSSRDPFTNSFYWTHLVFWKFFTNNFSCPFQESVQWVFRLYLKVNSSSWLYYYFACR